MQWPLSVWWIILSFYTICTSSVNVSIDTWHCRFGHPSISRLHVLKDILNLDTCSVKDCHFKYCTVCPLEKQKRLSFKSSHHMIKNCFDLIHVDIWGPLAHATHNGYRYFLTIVDDYSHYIWIFLLRSKYDVLSIIPQFFTYVETQFNARIKCFRSDTA